MRLLVIVLSGLLFFGCTLPQGTRKVTAWGVGFIPTGTGFPLPFAGYWHSEHGEDVISEQSAHPSFPTMSSSTPNLDEFMCVADGQVLHCGSYEAWDRFKAEQMKKHGL